jgi:hypothetical protein
MTFAVLAGTFPFCRKHGLQLMLTRKSAKFWLPSFCLLLVLLSGSAAADRISTRGYYMTFMRMPTFGLPEWKEMTDCIARDGGNTLLLWTAGGFRSKKFPITWRYNQTHKNIENDFVRELIDYAHGKGIKVLLCFTPFAYDGVNQYPLEHPELKARQKNSEPANYWGMHSWGYNLCPSQPASQQFLLEYVREMFFEFYPKADGLMIESSDYAICYCADCRERFFDREFQFVRRISDEVWRAKPTATIVVYPHYFSTRKVPGFDVSGAQQTFDPRWTLFFTPHSAHIETNLIAHSRGSIYSNEGLSLGTPPKIRDAIRLTHKNNITGYVPSLEPMTCPAGPPKNQGPLLKPFNFEWLRDGQMPLDELPIRVNRIAYREYTRDPDLSDSDFRERLGREIFGANTGAQNVPDLLDLQECWFAEAEWLAPGSYVAPQRLKDRAAREKWPAERLNGYRQRVEGLRALANRYTTSTNAAEREMRRIAEIIVQKWDATRFVP